MNRGKVVIIPDEEQILSDKFEFDVMDEKGHVKAYQEFSDKYKLGFSFSLDDSQQASLSIASIGHFTYKVEDNASLLVFYLPQDITERQLTHFQNNFFDFSKYKMIGAYSLIEVDNRIVSKEVEGLNNINQEMIKKYNKTKKKEEKGHVR
jgi:hypothetical protein